MAARSRTQPATATARGRRQTTASLPLDVLVDIAARSDPATLVRCAATCVDMRCRVKEYIRLRGRLRLRHGDRFVLPLLRGHLIRGHHRKKELFLVDTAAADDTTMHRATTISSVPLASRDGLVLLLVDGELRVCNQVTATSQTLPPEPAF
uniref:F-box domain-containing protein n=2 Tax=Triticum urartu TaxID=4572 RepID=A0A8R7UQV1_TRIUA